ncbi:SEC-C metal-binding domain-containing protein [Streptomyces sp. NPDC101152]|uniref:SEC-C metal-binding domain-containing protein n=1 Tax=Streptomyces sp. NPDC101152 TaxID=3366116 RepID=UPI00381EF5A8
MASKRRQSGKQKTTRRTRQPTTPAQAAQEYVRLVEHYPEDREELFREAADAWRSAGEHDRALALYERLLDPESGGCKEPDVVDAWRIDTLWEAGREEEARTAAASFRARHPSDATAWSLVAGTFEHVDETGTAAEWFTTGVIHALGAGAEVTADVVEDFRDSFGLEELLIGRHRVRRVLGEPHDDWDDVADEVHERRASPLFGRVRPLDELHDPLRLKRMAEAGPDALWAEMEEFAAATGEERVSPGRALRTCVLFWPPEEFARLVERWPAVVEAYGDDHAGHLRQVEGTLRELSDQGGVHLAVARATLSALEAYMEEKGGSPDTASARSGYAAEMARRGEAVDWPPARNGPCWCGSERKYKKCCGNPAFG